MNYNTMYYTTQKRKLSSILKGGLTQNRTELATKKVKMSIGSATVLSLAI